MANNTLDIVKVQNLLQGTNIQAIEFLDNSKASEFYVRAKFVQDDGFEWTSIIPYEYRRTGLKLKTEEKIAEYLISVKRFFTKEWMSSWVQKVKSECLADIKNKKRENQEKVSRGKKPSSIVTPYFLRALLSLEETPGSKLPRNRNPQRRLQDLKDSGYTIPIVQYGREKTTSTLLPFPLYQKMGYETFTPKFKARVIRLFLGRNAYEAKETTKKALIPDHKFSEVRWDEETKAENSMEMTDAEIIQKFQLLDNQRNQEKREVCRDCFQTGIRGTIYGIDFFYEGDEHWNPEIPKTGKAAEKGCVGCPWYDIEEWRKQLSKKLNGKVN